MMSAVDRAAKLVRLTDSYLDHIRIAVEADDQGAPFRTFIDCWHAYSHEADHHRSKGDRQIWFNNPDARTRQGMLYSLPFRSAGAEAILAYARENAAEYRSRRDGKDKAISLIVDHAVPLGEIIRMLFASDADLSREGVRALLTRYYHLGLITPEEDRRITRLKLRDCMPSDWDGNDMFVRYRIAEIEAAPSKMD